MKGSWLTSSIRKNSFAPASRVGITMASKWLIRASSTALRSPEAIHQHRRHRSHFATCVGSQTASKLHFEVSCCFSHIVVMTISLPNSKCFTTHVVLP
ncbi:hypothetical protein EVAR_99929_1 [Eumeta japonica]|uniref:Uncharacterized protein n=1 Tax=Eumeta variegata TaxID=151549 RepID=A0A4C1Z1B5_EUMVA|nr:hypothetical protein EVAR_99929_1 [Eumeta japonica]